jgi:hypothetical protein
MTPRNRPQTLGAILAQPYLPVITPPVPTPASRAGIEITGPGPIYGQDNQHWVSIPDLIRFADYGPRRQPDFTARMPIRHIR